MECQRRSPLEHDRVVFAGQPPGLSCPLHRFENPHLLLQLPDHSDQVLNVVADCRRAVPDGSLPFEISQPVDCRARARPIWPCRGELADAPRPAAINALTRGVVAPIGVESTGVKHLNDFPVPKGASHLSGEDDSQFELCATATWAPHQRNPRVSGPIPGLRPHTEIVSRRGCVSTSVSSGPMHLKGSACAKQPWRLRLASAQGVRNTG